MKKKGLQIHRLVWFSLVFWMLPAAAAELLQFSITEPGMDAYSSRVIVTERHLRMDDGDGAPDEDYILMDREDGTLYSVTHSDQTVFVIRPLAEAPKTFAQPELRTERVATAPDTPAVAGQIPQHHHLYVAGKACHNVVSIALLPDSVAALAQFRRTLAGPRALSLASLPADMQDPCDLAVNIYHPDWPLRFGLPIQEWSEVEERARAVVDFAEDYEADPALFELPANYERFSAGP